MSNCTLSLTNTLDPLWELMVLYCSNSAAQSIERPYGESDYILKKLIQFHSCILMCNKTCPCVVSAIRCRDICVAVVVFMG